jgi:hypothetical protein
MLGALSKREEEMLKEDKGEKKVTLNKTKDFNRRKRRE